MSFQHGGQLEKIQQDYPQQAQPWIDLSTGISPFAYSSSSENEARPQALAAKSLPQHHTQLLNAAAEYYGSDQLVLTPGSMWGIQNVPLFRRLLFPDDTRPVLLPRQGFNEHKKAWQAWGYDIEFYETEPTQAQLEKVQACIVINPNNPTGHVFEKVQLKAMHNSLMANDAYLLIDEAFLDVMPQLSMACQLNKQSLIILKSFGKYFGLPGLRVGALMAPPEILDIANKLLNQWSIATLAQQVAINAFLDKPWHWANNRQLNGSGNRLKGLLTQCGLHVQGTVYFQTHYSDYAKPLYEYLLSKGIYTRLLDDESGIRFGLPKNESQWARLESALLEFKQLKQTTKSKTKYPHFKQAESV